MVGMTILTVFEDSVRRAQIAATDDPVAIEAGLAAIGVGFERLSVPVALPADADDNAVLTAYGASIAALRLGDSGAPDVIRVLQRSPNRAELRAQWATEHMHEDDETTFLVEGRGMLSVRVGTTLAQVQMRAGDVVRMPAGVAHGFDAGERPFCTAVRLLSRTDRFAILPFGPRLAGHFLASLG